LPDMTQNNHKPLSWFRLWFSMGLGLAGGVIYLSLTPNPVQTPGIAFGDKIGHFVAYFSLVFWFSQLYFNRHHGWLLLIFILMGTLLEFAQAQTGYRTFQYADMLANNSGALCGWLLARTRCDQLLLYIDSRLSRSL